MGLFAILYSTYVQHRARLTHSFAVNHIGGQREVVGPVSYGVRNSRHPTHFRKGKSGKVKKSMAIYHLFGCEGSLRWSFLGHRLGWISRLGWCGGGGGTGTCRSLLLSLRHGGRACPLGRLSLVGGLIPHRIVHLRGGWPAATWSPFLGAGGPDDAKFSNSW